MTTATSYHATIYTHNTPDCEPYSHHDWIDAPPPYSLIHERSEVCSLCGAMRHTLYGGQVLYKVPANA